MSVQPSNSSNSPLNPYTNALSYISTNPNLIDSHPDPPVHDSFQIKGTSFSAAVHNVQGMCAPTTQELILQFIKLKKLDIIGLVETHLPLSLANTLYRSDPDYSSWWESPPTANFAGVGLLINKSISKYVQSVKGYKGRVLRVTLYLKGCVKLCIILCYIPANTRDRSIRTDIDKFILDNIAYHHDHGFHIMLLGDFNASPERLSILLEANKPIPWKLNLIRQLRRLNFIDTYLQFHDSPKCTWFSSTSSSRIDLIWISESLHLELLYCVHVDPRIYSSDHLGVICYFLTQGIFQRAQHASQKRNSAGRTVFSYASTKPEQWAEFETLTSTFYTASQLKLLKSSPISTNWLNAHWDLIQQGIMSSAHTALPARKVKDIPPQLKPDHLVKLYS